MCEARERYSTLCGRYCIYCIVAEQTSSILHVCLQFSLSSSLSSCNRVIFQCQLSREVSIETLQNLYAREQTYRSSSRLYLCLFLRFLFSNLELCNALLPYWRRRPCRSCFGWFFIRRIPVVLLTQVSPRHIAILCCFAHLEAVV